MVEVPIRPPVNPDSVTRAQFYLGLLDAGVVENRADLARYLGVSRARVTQILKRLETFDKESPARTGRAASDSGVSGAAHPTPLSA